MIFNSIEIIGFLSSYILMCYRNRIDELLSKVMETGILSNAGILPIINKVRFNSCNILLDAAYEILVELQEISFIFMDAVP